MATIAFIGLGAMGYPMAGRLARQGHAVTGIDRNSDTQDRWQREFGATPAPLGSAEAVLICVTDEAAAQAVFEQGLAHWRPGTLVIEHGTTSARWAREADAQARAAGLRYCDAPLSGGAAGAGRGELVAMLGAHPADADPAIRLMSAYAASCLHLGPPGAGQLCKMANQIAIAGVAAGLAQAQSFSRAAGLDPAQVFDALARGSAASVQLERLRATLSEPDNNASRTFEWLRKDLELCAEAAPRGLALADLWTALWESDS
ncbi:MAG: NAD(P)-dependent oxidoreductase [Burkholderiales bacterium]|nr:NAD(P)-dependent oxidoreductase [Burkholderiales bacterium]